MNTIERILTGTYPDPDGGPPLAVPTLAVTIAESLAGQEDALVASLGLGRRLAVVSDPTTRDVLGARVEQALGACGEIASIVLPEHPHADMETVDKLRAATGEADALIAVGSGTINDLCKFAAARDGKPYAVFGTAPSMNGYTSLNAAITENGLKRSLPAAAPVGVFLDLRVLANAPARMIRSGLGDSLCRATAQADWLLAHLLFDQPYRSAPFVLLAEDEDELFAQSRALLAGDIEIMGRLARTLVLSGFGMTICGGSYPASQGEHLIGHYVEMMAPDLPPAFHGEQIGVTTLTMAHLQEELIASAPPRLKPTNVTEQAVVAHFGPETGAACWAEFAKKRLDTADAEALNARLEERWSDIVAALSAVMRPSHELRKILENAGAPTTPEALHWSADFYRGAVCHARELRNRYTALDLAGDAGLLESFADGNDA